MINLGGLIPLLRMLLWLPLLLIARLRGKRKAIVWYAKRLQYENYCVQWWDMGGPEVGWKGFQQSRNRHEILHFYRVEVPQIIAKRAGIM